MNYLLTVGLHALGFSLVAFLVVGLLRRPESRAFVTRFFLVATALLPWLTALDSSEIRIPSWKDDPATVSRAMSPAIEDDSAPKAFTIATSTLSRPIIASESPTPDRLQPDWWHGILALWGTGAVLGFASFIVRSCREIRWRNRLRMPDSAETERLPDARCRVVPSGCSPCVAGVLRPLLVVPVDLFERPRELRWALAHEREHLRGHDTRWVAFFGLVRAVFWWNPIVHWLIRRWSAAREELCDLAAAGPDERGDYGEFLLGVAVRRRPAGGVAMARHPLRGRIARLLEAPADPRSRSRALPWFAATGVVVVGCALTALRLEAGEPDGGNTEDVAASEERSLPEGAIEQQARLPQITFSSRLILTPLEIEGDDRILDGVQAEKRLREIASDDHSEVADFPSITARNAEMAMIEVVRIPEDEDSEKPHNAQAPLVDESGHPLQTFAGTVLRIEGFQTADSELMVRGSVSYSGRPGEHFALRPDKESAFEIRWNELQRFQRKFRAVFEEPGSTYIMKLAEIEDGRHLEWHVTAAPIDYTGRPVERFSKTMPAQPAPAPLTSDPRIRFKATIATFPSGAALPEWLQVDDPPEGEDQPGTLLRKLGLEWPSAPVLGPLTPDMVERFRESTPEDQGVRFHTLPDLTVPNEAETGLCRWEDVEGFQFSTRGLREPGVVDLSVQISAGRPVDPGTADKKSSIGMTMPSNLILGIRLPPEGDEAYRVLFFSAAADSE